MKAPRLQKRESIPAMYDVANKDGLVLFVKPDPRSKKHDKTKEILLAEAKKAKANEQRLEQLVSQNITSRAHEIDEFVLGWKGMTPKVLQGLLVGGGAALSDEQVKRMEADLEASGETEYEFDAVTYKELLEDGPLFHDRVTTLWWDLGALVEAEEAYRRFFSQPTSSGGTNAAN